jgi:hypothetical protein
MPPDRIASRTASLCADLAALGIPTDNLGQGVVDLMIERRDGERHGEMRLMVAEDGESVTLCTVWHVLDEDGGLRVDDDTEHDEHDVFDSEGVAISIREITRGAA